MSKKTQSLARLRKEEALNRIAFLCIKTGDSETAMAALTLLSEVNPMYQATLEQLKKVA